MITFENFLISSLLICEVVVCVITIHACCRTRFKKAAAAVVSKCITEKPKWGDNDDLDELITFGTHQKTLMALKQEFLIKTSQLESKVEQLERADNPSLAVNNIENAMNLSMHFVSRPKVDLDATNNIIPAPVLVNNFGR